MTISINGTEIAQEIIDLLPNLIRSGTLDETLSAIHSACHDRKDSLRARDSRRSMAEIVVGDTVKVVDCNPKYMNGMTGTVTAKNRTRIILRLDKDGKANPRTGRIRFRAGVDINVPPTCLEKIEG